jgi:hypothetical protein
MPAARIWLLIVEQLSARDIEGPASSERLTVETTIQNRRMGRPQPFAWEQYSRCQATDNQNTVQHEVMRRSRLTPQ